MASGAVDDRNSSSLLTVSDGGRESSNVWGRGRDRFAASYTVVGIESTSEERMRVGVGPSMGLSARQAGARGAGQRGTLMRQWPRGLLHLLEFDEVISITEPRGSGNKPARRPLIRSVILLRRPLPTTWIAR